ncbi:MAG: hypothetical protein HY721_28460, partial [Planctomycetes bacterium]|nr:hypothetical protein [Planctomycetota bacterium]
MLRGKTVAPVARLLGPGLMALVVWTARVHAQSSPSDPEIAQCEPCGDGDQISPSPAGSVPGIPECTAPSSSLEPSDPYGAITVQLDLASYVSAVFPRSAYGTATV